ncbi:MAG: hypothetical protein ABI276_06890 [Acidimicrobiales bacterium]
MSIWAALAGGFAGTLVLTTVLRGGSELRLTRMDLPFLLGTVVTVDRRRAKLIGYLAHFGFGLLFALAYFALFKATGRAGWALGAIFGLVHGVFSITALVNVLLPALHPRMGTPFTAADSSPLIEPPGFVMRNYGRSTALVSLAAHILYGTIVGGFIGFTL